MNTWEDRLSDYLDGGLTEEERRAVEAHLAEHPATARTLEELRQVVRRAQALDDRAPTADLWAGIAGRIGASVPARPADRRPTLPVRWWRRQLAVSVPQLLAAGIATAVIAAGTVWAVRTTDPVPPASVAADTGTVDIALASTATTKYDRAITELSAVLERERESLSPETIRIVEENLALIDRAFRQAAEALAADPGSEYLRRHLEATARRKLNLLRRVTAFTGAA